MDDNLVCIFTSVVGCLTCETATMLSWHADDEIAGPAKAIMEVYRTGHETHDKYFEGVPGIGLLHPEDAIPVGISLVSTVSAQPDPCDPDSISFGPYGHSVEYAHAPPKP